MFNSNNHYTTKIFYIPLFICIIIFFILNIIGISVYSTKNIDYKNNISRRLSKERTLNQCNCCCCNCQCNNNNSNNQSQNQNGGSSDNTQNNEPNNSDSQNKSDDIDKNKSDNQNNSGNNINESDKKDNSDHNKIPGNNDDNKNGNNSGNYGGNNKKNEKKRNNNIIRLKKSEFALSFSLFSFSIIFTALLFCFIIKYVSRFEGSYFLCHFICLSIPLFIYFIFDIILISIRISCNESYKLLYGKDKFIKQNNGLIFLNFFQLFILLLIYFFLILIIFCVYEKICQVFSEFLTFLCCCFYCECNCDNIKQFLGYICEKKLNIQSDNPDIIKKRRPYNETNLVIQSVEIYLGAIKDDHNIDNINNDNKPNFINEELKPIEQNNDKNRSNDNISNCSSKGQIKNPEAPNSEMYTPNCLFGQKILIVMTYYEDKCNIGKLYENGDNKTVKEAVEHFGITIFPVSTYEDAIKELTKNEKGKCPYYSCWLINSNKEISEDAENFLNILMKFWKNGGAVVLFSDNEPFIQETNRFLSMINAGFIMEGKYIGKELIYGDDTGKLLAPGLFNRKKDDFIFGNIERQKLSHNLYVIFEGETISSVTKDGKRKLNVKNDDIKPFIPFARDSEGGITSLIRLSRKNGEGDIIIDGGATKLFINMKEEGTFRYIQNIAGFTARPEIHYQNGINPKDYRPKSVK